MKSSSGTLTVELNSQRSKTSVRQRMSVVAIKDFGVLEDYLAAWEDLAANALEPNPFYEPWMLMPALRWLTTGGHVQLVLVLAVEQNSPILCGVFPLEKKSTFKRLPIVTYRLWQHIYCALCTPLIRADRARDTLDAFLNWLEAERDCSLMEFNLVSGDGPFRDVLVDCLNRRARQSIVSESHTRAFFRPMENADAYLRAAVSSKHRQEMRRLERRLAETGEVEWRALEPDEDVDTWIEDFLQLEARGWKGRQASALVATEAGRNFFTTLAREAFDRGKLMLLRVRVNGQLLAERVSFTAGRGAFAFKTAYDENHARFSPGILLELENIRRLHATPEIEWMDSCATPVHFIDRLWLDRRSIQTVLVSTGRRTGDLLVSLLPFLKRLNQGLKSVRRKEEDQ